ncbi:MAG: hypothetical protein QUS14_10655, partial [Pyrinomonadaceae bacterium]|nr:hypothetical protein [Pyrinomonadaceae bacterium]
MATIRIPGSARLFAEKLCRSEAALLLRASAARFAGSGLGAANHGFRKASTRGYNLPPVSRALKK